MNTFVVSNFRSICYGHNTTHIGISPHFGTPLKWALLMLLILSMEQLGLSILSRLLFFHFHPILKKKLFLLSTIFNPF